MVTVRKFSPRAWLTKFGRRSAPFHPDDSGSWAVWAIRLNILRAELLTLRGLVMQWSLSFQADPVPQLQVEQSPDAIVVVAVAGSIFPEELLHRGLPKQSTAHVARFEKQVPVAVELRAGQPATPRSWEPQLRTINNR